jgi:hypothetical protein
VLLFAAAVTITAAASNAAPPASSASAVELATAAKVFDSPSAPPGSTVLTSDDEKFLDDLQQRSLRFFIDEADRVTGLMPDRAKASGGAVNGVSSTASVGFGLTALCIGVERGWIPKQDAYDQCLRVLKFLGTLPHEHGHFYHFIDMRSGQRVWNSEISNIDTALLMGGVITVRQYFPNNELAKFANDLNERVEWTWLMESNGLLRHGYRPESGFIDSHWGAYSEGPVLIHLLGMGSRTHPLPASSWKAWKREPVMTYAGLTYIQCPPLFTHQYPQCWFDLRGLRDDFADYFRNSQLATIAQRQWCMDELGKRYPTYGPEVWGITASDGPDGYKAWGGPDPKGEKDEDINGVVGPAAAAGSLPFEPRLCLKALQNMHQKFGTMAYVKYGFVDAFNPGSNWYTSDVIGIDVGPTVVMAENCRSGFVWKVFMSSEEAQKAVKAAGFRPLGPQEADQATTSLFNTATPENPAKR